ncbi:hypothetical protein [Escherichia coli]|nr:hypothetical protein [Escherichia coli]MED6348737.1 hypothetical protein [Escherichia coli O157]MCV5440214.1 hypothetical protein [Escherichia coli]MCZ5946531.1 hypothetical protein [Escherichia coli]MDD8566624.1 hypothetical protein [Escherichia coli]MDI1191722.1 hypothetical protein [Escherichia coli]
MSIFRIHLDCNKKA